MRLSRSQRRTGTRRPQRGSVGRVRLYNVTDDAGVDGSPVRLCWVSGRSRSGGRASAANGAELRIQRGALRSTTRRLSSMPGSVRSVVQHGVDHAHQLVGGGKDPSRYPTLCGLNDLRQVQRRDATLHLPVQVHARRASWSVSVTLGSAAATREVLKRDIPGLRGIHTGIRRCADPTTGRGRSCTALSNPDHQTWLARRSPVHQPPPRIGLVSPPPATLLRLRKSPEIQGETRGRPRVSPERDHRRDWVAVGAVSSEPVSHVDKRIKDECLMGPYYVPLQTP